MRETIPTRNSAMIFFGSPCTVCEISSITIIGNHQNGLTESKRNKWKLIVIFTTSICFNFFFFFLQYVGMYIHPSTNSSVSTFHTHVFNIEYKFIHSIFSWVKREQKKYTQTNFSGQQFLHADQREWRPIARLFYILWGKHNLKFWTHN